MREDGGLEGDHWAAIGLGIGDLRTEKRATVSGIRRSGHHRREYGQYADNVSTSSPSSSPAALIPLPLLQWIDEHNDEFSGPVSNRVLWPNSEFIFMVVRGPNARNDFHIDPGDEIFYQLEGTIRVDTIDDAGTIGSQLVQAGDLLLVPAGVPHSPMRPAGSWGVVIERQRSPDEVDQILWVCEQCGADVHRSTFHLSNIETELRELLEGFAADETLRTCPVCTTVKPIAEPFELDAT